MAYRHLCSEERYAIAAYLNLGMSIREIARHSQPSPSTISRELRRNRSGSRRYDAQCADQRAHKRRRDASKRPWKLTPRMCREIHRRLEWEHTPEMIAGCCRVEGIEMVSTEWIYQVVYREKEAGGALWRFLPQHRKQRTKRCSTRSWRGMISNRVSIHERPCVVEERSRIGEVEADRIIGRGRRNGLLRVVDRCSRYVQIGRLDRVAAEETRVAITRLLKGHPVETITTDNGKEFSLHHLIAEEPGIEFSFADPYRSSQRGTNEQTNGLIRRYFRKGTDFNRVSDVEIEMVAYRLKNRPRKCLGWKRPWEVYCGKAPPPVALQT